VVDSQVSESARTQIRIMATTRRQEVGGDSDGVHTSNSENYPIRFGAKGGVYAKFWVVYRQSRVVCAEWLPFYKSVSGLVTSVSRSLEKKSAKADSDYMQSSDAASGPPHRGGEDIGRPQRTEKLWVFSLAL
jgi:hypothetical protein